MSDLKPCPFCGCAEIYLQPMDWCSCENEDCHTIGPSMGSAAEAIEAWNTRPEEDRLRSEVAELVGALRVMTNYARWQFKEGSEHHPTLPSAIYQSEAILSKHEGK